MSNEGKALTVSQILGGVQPASAVEARRLVTIYSTQARAAQSLLDSEGDASKAARLRQKIGRIETAVGICESWASAL